MSCDCAINLVDSYDVSFIQGDYASFLYEITDQNGDAIPAIENVVFSSKRMNVVKKLLKISDTTFALKFESEETAAMNAPVKTSYDLTIEFTNDASPITIIYNAMFTIYKKENAING